MYIKACTPLPFTLVKFSFPFPQVLSLKFSVSKLQVLVLVSEVLAYLHYKFDLADFVSYETLCESFLVAQPQGHRALSYGGIVARLARESLPDSSVATAASANSQPSRVT